MSDTPKLISIELEGENIFNTYVNTDDLDSVFVHIKKYFSGESKEIKQPIEEDKDFQLKLKDAVNVEFRIKIEALEIENKNLKQQLREQIASAAISNDALLELNRKIKENTIDKVIEWCDEKISLSQNEERFYFNQMKTFLESLK